MMPSLAGVQGAHCNLQGQRVLSTPMSALLYQPNTTVCVWVHADPPVEALIKTSEDDSRALRHDEKTLIKRSWTNKTYGRK